MPVGVRGVGFSRLEERVTLGGSPMGTLTNFEDTNGKGLKSYWQS